MDQLDEIRQKINIIDLVGEHVSLKKAGRNFKALCPFHSEVQPSFIVSPERQIFKCFGCGVGGDVFKFLMLSEGMEFGEALKTLAERAGVKLKPFQVSEGESRRQLLYEINHLAAEFYHYLLLKHPVGKKALDYILGRGISRESLDFFKLGFSPDKWDSLQKFLLRKKGYRITDLEEAGLVIKSSRGSFYDRFRGRLMFPLTDHRGNICGFAGRLLVKEVQEAKYINSPDTPIYHKSQLLYGLWQTRSQIKQADAAVMVEGELDAISSYQADIKNVVAIKGSALTQEQLQLLNRFTQNLILALDSDLAGDAAARRGIELADSLGFSLKVVEVQGGKDPDEVAQNNPDLWQKQVRLAVPIYDYFLDSATRRFNIQTAEGKRKIGRELVPILAKISDNFVRGHYVSQLSYRMGVSEEAVEEEIAKFSKTSGLKIPSPVVVEPIKRKYYLILEEYLLALCLQTGSWSLLTKKRVRELIKNPATLRIIEGLKKYLKKFKVIKSRRLAKMLPLELQEIFNQAYFYDLGDWIEDEEKVKTEIERTLRDLENLMTKDKLRLLSQKIKDLEKNKDKSGELERLSEEFRKFSAKILSF